MKRTQHTHNTNTSQASRRTAKNITLSGEARKMLAYLSSNDARNESNMIEWLIRRRYAEVSTTAVNKARKMA